MKSIIKANDLKQLIRSTPVSIAIEGEFNYNTPQFKNVYSGHSENCLISIPFGVNVPQVFTLPYQAGTAIIETIARAHGKVSKYKLTTSLNSYILNIRISSVLNGRTYTRNYQTNIRSQLSRNSYPGDMRSEVAIDTFERLFIDSYIPKTIGDKVNGIGNEAKCTCNTRVNETIFADGSSTDTTDQLIQYANTNSFDMRPIGDYFTTIDAINMRLDDVFAILYIKTTPLDHEGGHFYCNNKICNLIMETLRQIYSDKEYHPCPSGYKTPVLLVVVDSTVNLTGVYHTLVARLADPKEKYAKNAHILLSQDWANNIENVDKQDWICKGGIRV